jgi:hypothetical protein
MAHDVEVDILVDIREELAHVLLQNLEDIVYVHLSDILAVRRWIVESETSPSRVGRVIYESIAVASAIWVDYARSIAAGLL